MTRLLDLFSNVWFGVFWAAQLFIYCSIGSALPPVRQLPWLEMTEFEWFQWWPFSVMVVVLCASLIVTTIRRIPLRPVNAGVWMIHGGVVILCAGSYYYFGTKVEGDAPVFRRQVVIKLPGMSEVRLLPALPGGATTVTVGPETWQFEVQDTNAEWPILSDEHKGETAYAVNVMVRPPRGEPFIRQLLAGYPQYTEDILPGRGRAIKSSGHRLVDEDLELTLDYQATDSFHVMDTWALFVRRAGEGEWTERPIEGLPRYNDRISSREQVFSDSNRRLPIRPIDMRVLPPSGGDALGDSAVQITGYLRYAQLDRRWGGGGDRLNPVLELSLLPEGGPAEGYELIAFDTQRSRAADGNIELVWLADRERIEALPTDARARLRIAVPEAGAVMEVPLIPEQLNADFTTIEGTDFAYRVTDIHDNLSLPGKDRPVSIVAVEVRVPEGTFRRWVADVPEHTRDLHGTGADPHSVESRLPDPRIVMTYRPQSAPLIFAAYPGGLHLLVNGPSGRMFAREIAQGEVVRVLPGFSVRVDGYFTNAVAEVKPFVVPPEQQQSKAGETFAMIRLEVGTGRGAERRWLRFNQYALPGEEYSYRGRFAYSPERFRLADGSSVEVLFSRRRMKLPNPIAMEDFRLDTHLGGYSGSASTIRNYVSRLRFLDDGKWSEPAEIAVNSPTEYGGFWYFQSTWDKPQSGETGGGMNFTGLGIGNRHGVYAQLAGCCLSVTGMIFAFYVKPLIKNRRAERSRVRVARTGLEELPDPQAGDAEAARETTAVRS